MNEEKASDIVARQGTVKPIVGGGNEVAGKSVIRRANLEGPKVSHLQKRRFAVL